MKLRLLAVFAMLIPALCGQDRLGNGYWDAPGGAAPLAPKMECSQLRSLTTYEFTV
ncbi:MAG: hypothetical protein IT160_14970, partial [Bryobacterales bacterium]|nr:hypothetical protein [Bryobacterales bacterium]